jgi:hypothetical protein
MQTENGSPDMALDDPPACGEPEPADDPLPPQAATSTARQVVVMTAATGQALLAGGSWLRPHVDADSGLAVFQFIGCSIRGAPQRRVLSGLPSSP